MWAKQERITGYFLTLCYGWCAWRALPARFGKHDTLRKHSRRWAQKGSWQRLFEAVQEPDLDWPMPSAGRCTPY